VLSVLRLERLSMLPTGDAAGGTEGKLDQIPPHFFLAIMQAIEAREPFPTARSRNTALYAVATARALLLPASTVSQVRLAALLSNIGMLGVPEVILGKTEPLNADEQAVIRQHPVLGAEILASVPQFQLLLPLVLHHHEDWNGRGYPNGISAERIPIGARIIRVVETYDALTAARPYRPAYTPDQALEMLVAGAGREFDPRVVNVFTTRMRRGAAISDDIIESWTAAQNDTQQAFQRTRGDI
jgi:HD-GYP domain-containing protein (c-di-GMP phosphodiesterase class II)